MERSKLIVALVLFSIIIRLPVLLDSPLDGDETLYAEIVDELPRSFPFTTYLGHVVPWKPPLTFYAHYAFKYALSQSGLSDEAIYRIPSALFGVLSVVAFFLLVEFLYKDERFAFFSSLIFSSIALLLITNLLFVTDSLLLFFMLVSLLFYLKGSEKGYYFLCGGAVFILAFLTKTVAALMAPLLAIIYFAILDKKTLKNKYFLLSLLSVPIAYVLLQLFYGNEFTAQFTLDAVARFSSLEELPLTLIVNLQHFMVLTFPLWSFILPFGEKAKRSEKESKRYRFVLLWLAFGIIPFLIAGPIIWYWLPVLPPLVLLASDKLFVKGYRKSFLFVILLIAIFLALMMLPVASFVYQTIFGTEHMKNLEKREVGTMVADRERVSIITYYGAPILFYKFHNEATPRYNDTNVIFAGGMNCSIIDDASLHRLIDNFNLDESNLSEGSLDIFYGLYYHRMSNLLVYGSFEGKSKYVVVEKRLCNFTIDEDQFEILKNGTYYLVLENKEYQQA